MVQTVYICACAEKGAGGGVYKYALQESGALEKKAYLPCDKPMFAAADGGKLHILLRAPFGGQSFVNPLARAARGAARPGGEEKCSGYFSCNADFSGVSEVKSTMGECACHIAATGGDTYIANYLSGNVVKNCHVCVLHEGAGVNLPRQDMPHTHFAAFSRDKTRVFCCDLGLDGIFVYDRNLNEISRATVPAGYGVRHLVLTKDGRTVYAVNELVPSVTVFAFDGNRLIRKATATLPSAAKTSCSRWIFRALMQAQTARPPYCGKSPAAEYPRAISIFSAIIFCAVTKLQITSLYFPSTRAALSANGAAKSACPPRFA